MTQPESLAVRWSSDSWIWLVGAALGLSLSGWAFDGDLLLNVDQVIGRQIYVPRGLFGEGTELPRRVPFYVPLAVLSRLIPGPILVGTILTASVAGSVVGLYRLAGRDDAALVSAVIYGVSPFLLTRAAVGHLPVVVACALLPWAIGSMQTTRRARTVLAWCLGFGLLGSSGALLGLVPAAIALFKIGENVTARLRLLALLCLTQFSWLVPGILVLAKGASLPTTPSSPFATRVSGLNDLLQLFAGGGFFIVGEDVAARATSWASVLGFGVLTLGVFGLANRSKLDLATLGGLVGLAAVAISIPRLGDPVWYQITEFGPFSLFRETQKFWPLAGVALGIGIAHSLRMTKIVSVRLLLSAVLIVLAGGSAAPGLFGADGRLVATASPDGWRQISDALDGQSGTVAVLPWQRYSRLGLSGGRNVLQPAPWLLGNDVVISGDPQLGLGFLERDDRFQQALAQLDLNVRGGQEIAPGLRSLDIEWVVINGSLDTDLYRRLGRELGVETMVDQDHYLLFRLR